MVSIHVVGRRSTVSSLADGGAVVGCDEFAEAEFARAARWVRRLDSGTQAAAAITGRTAQLASATCQPNWVTSGPVADRVIIVPTFSAAV
jgi:hypothetical protein